MNLLADLAADVEWPDSETAELFRTEAGEHSGWGTLAGLGAWAAGVQAACPPHPFTRIRVIRFHRPGDTSTPRAAAPQARDEVGADADAALQAGAGVADDEIERGADLLVVSAGAGRTTAATLVAVATGTEPVKVLPRGAATAPAEWSAAAIAIRDGRRRLMPLREQPFELLTEAGDPAIAAATGLLMRAASRRTPVLYDGLTAAAAALIGFEAQPRAARWWRPADQSDHPAHQLALTRLGHRPVLEFGTALDDGTAGQLAAGILQAAIGLDAARAGQHPDDRQDIP